MDQPAEISRERLDLLDAEPVPVAGHFGYKTDWALPSIDRLDEARVTLL